MPSQHKLQQWLSILTALTSISSVGAQSTSTFTSSLPSPTGTFEFEIGAVFPRANETYKTTDILPIAFAIRNFGAIKDAGGNFTFSWDVMPYSAAGVPSGVTYDDRDIPLASGTTVHTVPGTSDTFVTLVDATNVTSWISRKQRGQQFMLHWHVNWDAFGAGRCKYSTSNVFGGVIFGIEAPWEETDSAWPAHGQGIPVDVIKSAGGQCAVFADASEGGSIVTFRPNATAASCPTVLDGASDPGSGRTADPCRMRIDTDVAKEIAELATRTASMRKPTPTASTTSSSTNVAWTMAPTQAAGMACAAAAMLVNF